MKIGLGGSKILNSRPQEGIGLSGAAARTGDFR